MSQDFQFEQPFPRRRRPNRAVVYAVLAGSILFLGGVITAAIVVTQQSRSQREQGDRPRAQVDQPQPIIATKTDEGLFKTKEPSPAGQQKQSQKEDGSKRSSQDRNDPNEQLPKPIAPAEKALPPVELFKKQALLFVRELEDYDALMKKNASAKEIERHIDRALAVHALIPGPSSDFPEFKFPRAITVRRFAGAAAQVLLNHQKKIAQTGEVDFKVSVLVNVYAKQIQDHVLLYWK